MNYQYPYNSSFNNRKRNEGTYLTKLTKQLAGILIIMLILLLCKYVKTGVTESINTKIKSIINLDYTKEAGAVFASSAPNVNDAFNKFLNKFNVKKEFKMDNLPLEGNIIGSFGKTIDAKTKKEVVNNGIDIEAKEGTNVKVIYDGTVETVENNKTMGLMIVIDHNNGFKTAYGNLKETSVNEGEAITKGTVIGLTGSASSNLKPHLHFEVLKNNVAVNPKDYLKSN